MKNEIPNQEVQGSFFNEIIKIKFVKYSRIIEESKFSKKKQIIKKILFYLLNVEEKYLEIIIVHFNSLILYSIDIDCLESLILRDFFFI